MMMMMRRRRGVMVAVVCIRTALPAALSVSRLSLATAAEGGGVGFRVICAVELSIGIAIHTPNLSRFLVSVGADVVVEIPFPSLFLLLTQLLCFILFCPTTASYSITCLLLILPLPLGFLFDDRRLTTQLRHCPILITVPTGDHASPAQLRTLRCITQCFPIRPLSSKYGALVIVPVTLAPLEPAVLGPEEEPDAQHDEEQADQREKGLDAFHVYGVWRDGAGAEFARWRCRVAGSEVAVRGEGVREELRIGRHCAFGEAF